VQQQDDRGVLRRRSDPGGTRRWAPGGEGHASGSGRPGPRRRPAGDRKPASPAAGRRGSPRSRT
jgi:hypothetical protein